MTELSVMNATDLKKELQFCLNTQLGGGYPNSPHDITDIIDALIKARITEGKVYAR